MNSVISNNEVEAAAAPARRGLAPSAVRRYGIKQFLSFAGPGYLVAVGYMDPGNWVTAIGGGSAFGYSLLSVVLLSNLMAMLLQAAASRMGLVTQMDLAQMCRRHFSARASIALWIGCEIAIVACNLAEVLGMAVGLQLLLHLPLTVGVFLTALDVVLVLQLQRRGMRRLEVFIIALIAIVAASLGAQLWWLHPTAQPMLRGLWALPEIVGNAQMLYFAVGIIGATIMPHNLYLHSALVRGRRLEPAAGGIRRALRLATLDSNVALGLAFFVNVGLLVLAAGTFHRPGQAPIVDLTQAYALLTPLLGVGAASAVFGLGLIASGLSSSITGTLAGQIVMEGFLDLRISRGARAALTRGLAIVPAAAAAMYFGSAGVSKLLMLSQVVLGIQLPFAVVPLLWFTTRRRYMEGYAFSVGASLLLWAVAIILIGVNVGVCISLLR